MLDYAIVSDTLGYLSILCWLGAQFPQVIVNFQTQSVEGLALPFLANWLLGDITNLVGCILTRQLPFQTYLASYFVFVDLSLVIQYIYYYKPPVPPEDLSPSPSPTLSPTVTLTPTGVIYSARNLTRPHSRTPLLSVSEVEGGYRTYDERAKSHPRSGSRRFSGVIAAYPPAGLLPSTEELSGSTSNTVRLHKRSESKPSLSSLRLRMDRASEKGKARDDAALKRRKSVDQEDDEDELGAMTESFYSDISAAAGNGRHVSWSRATTGHPPKRASSFHQSPIEEGEQTPTLGGEIVGGEDDELRRRSRSRGRPSTRSRLQPLLVYNPASPVDDEGGEGTSAAHGTENRGLEVESERERASKSGSRRRSASIVFLSVGLGAFFVMNKGPSPASVHSPMGVARAGYPRGQVLDWKSVVEDAPRIPESLVEETVVHFPSPDNSYADAKEEPTWTLDRSHKDRSRHDPPPLTPEQKRRLVGRISAWACTTLYLTSRLPQIWKNYTRGSVQGLSLALFVFAFLGNTFYVASILSSPIIWEYPSGAQPIDVTMYPDLNAVSTTATTYSTSSPPAVSVPDPTSVYKHRYRHGGHLDTPEGDPIPPYRTPRARAFLRESMPYLLGSGGTLCFDVIIVTQGIIYGRREKMIEEEEDEEDEDEDGENEDENEEGEREVEEGGNERREELDDREDTRLLKQAEEPGGVNDPGHAEERSRKVGDLLAPGDDRHG